MSQRYQVQGKIGQGGLGEVYLAKDTQLDRDVALKRVKVPEGGNLEAMSADLIREAKTLSALQHPNIVTVYDVGKDENGPFVVLELLKGETLDAVIERGGMTLDDFKQVVMQTLEGLLAAQAVGLVHRDLKPGNLMVIWLASGKFQIKILDFGLAKFGLKARPQTEDQGGGIFGSIFFMAPEQFERFPLDARTDMYSLGCIYYQILTTKHPFDGETGAEVMASHLQHHVKPLKQVRGDLPDWLCHWVMWLISREMDDRPSDARIALEYFTAQQHGLKGVPPPPTAGSGTSGRLGAPRPVYRPGAVGATTGPIAGNASQAIQAQGTMAAARSSTPVVEKIVKPKSNKGLWIGLSVLIAALAGGIAYLFLAPQPPVAETVTTSPPPPVTPPPPAPKESPPTPPEVAPKPTVQTPPEPQKPKPKPAVVVAPKPTPAPAPAVAPSSAGKALLDGLLGSDLAGVVAKLPPVEKARIPLLASALASASPAERTRLHRIIGSEQLMNSSQLLRADLNHASADVREAALKAVSAFFPKTSVADDLLKCAQAGELDNALAAYGFLTSRFGTKVEDRVALLKKAQPLATSPASKNSLIQAVSTIAHPSAKVLAKELQAPAAEQMVTAAIAKIKVASPGADLLLPASEAYIMGPLLGAPTLDPATNSIVGWTSPENFVGWDVEFKAQREVRIRLSLTNTAKETASYRLIVGKPSLPLIVPQSPSDTQPVSTEDVSITVTPGIYRFVIAPANLPPGQSLMQLRGAILLKQ